MMSTHVQQLKTARFVLKIIYPNFNSHQFITYLIIRYLVDWDFKRIYKKSHLRGYRFKVIPERLHYNIVKETLDISEGYDIQHQIIVPRDLFEKLYSENIFYRDGNSLWLSVEVPIAKKMIECNLAINFAKRDEPAHFSKVKKSLSYISNVLHLDNVLRKRIVQTVPQPSKSLKSNRVESEVSENISKAKTSFSYFNSALNLDDVFHERIVQIIPQAGRLSNLVYLTETQLFNIKNNLGSKYLDDFRLKFIHLSGQHLAPCIASLMVVQMVNSSTHIGADLVEVMLNNYFKTPRLLHKNDYFGIGVAEEFTGHLHMKYSSTLKHISKIYFKCTQLKSKNEYFSSNKAIKSVNIACFVLRGETKLLQEQHFNSVIPPRRFVTIHAEKVLSPIPICHQFVEACPFGLCKYLHQMLLAIKPFVQDVKVSPLHREIKCVVQPVFLLRGDLGAGSRILTAQIAERLGLHYISTTCRHITSSTAKQTEAKIDALFQKAKNISPVLIHLQDFDVLGIDAENKEDARVVDSFIKKLSNLYEHFTKFPIILIASCDTSVELQSNILRIFLEEFKIVNPNTEDRLEMLAWLSLIKNLTFCNENFEPLKKSKVIKSEPKSLVLRKKQDNTRRVKLKGVGKKTILKIDHNMKQENQNLKVISQNETGSHEGEDYHKLVELLEKKEFHFHEEIHRNNLLKLVIDENVLAILDKISSKTECYIYGDLDTLTNLSVMNGFVAQKSISKDNEINSLENSNIAKMGLVREKDFEDAIESLRLIQSKKLGSLKIPNVSWEDIGGLEDLKKEIFRTIELPLKFPHLLFNSGLKRSGLLLWGPPGCGKTLVARAISSQLRAAFLSVKGPELLDMYVGQSERNMRDMFAMARASAPCVIFLDEAEAAAGARGASGDAGGAADRLVSQLLAELDGVARQTDTQTGTVIVVAATNRPDLVEPALLRPGRLDKLLYVGPYQGTANKVRVLNASCRGMNLSSCVNLENVSVQLPDKCTGADLASVVNKARRSSLTRTIQSAELGKTDVSTLTESDIIITDEDFKKAIASFVPSISKREMDHYESLRNKLS